MKTVVRSPANAQHLIRAFSALDLEIGGDCSARTNSPRVATTDGKLRRRARVAMLSGAWVLRGTRIPVSAIFQNLEAGANLDDMMAWYQGLDRRQVKAGVEFAARSLDHAPALTPSMLVLPDQATPVPIRSSLGGHTVRTAYEQGWDELKNGELLAAATRPALMFV